VAYGKGENDPYTSENQTLALGTGMADVVLGIPEALVNLAMRNYYNAPVGKQYTFEEAAQAAGDNPIVKAAGMIRSGSWFGLEKDPAYRKDPISFILSLPTLGVRGIAKKFGVSEDAAQLAFDNATVLYPLLGKAKSGAWQVKDNMSKLPSKEAPTTESVARLQAEADAAAKKVEAPRLEAPKPDNAIEVSPEGIATLPKKTTTSETPGARGLAEDKLASEAAARRLQEAEAAKAVATKAEAAKARNAEALKNYGIITGLVPFPQVTSKRVLSGGTDFSTTPPSEVIEGPPISNAPYPDEYTRGIKPSPDITPVDQAKKVAEQVAPPPPPAPPAPKTTGFSNEDILTMGLNMMMAQPGQPGGELSQLASNVGRSGLATLQSRIDRSKLAADQAFRELYGKYLQKQTDVMGQEPPEIRTVRAFQKEPGLLDTHREMYENRTSPAMLLKTYEDARTKAELGFNEAWLTKNPDFQTWLRNSGYGGAAISPTVLEKVNLYK